MKLTLAPSSSVPLNERRLGASFCRIAALSVAVVAISFSTAQANVIVNGDFNADLIGWTPSAQNDATWSRVDYMGNIGSVAQFNSGSTATNGGTLSQTFVAQTSPISLTFDSTWLFGANDSSDSSMGIMLLNNVGDGYVFFDRRNSIGYGISWFSVTGGVYGAENQIDVNTSQPAASTYGYLGHFTLTNDAAGNWDYSANFVNSGGPNPAIGSWSAEIFTGNAVTSFTSLTLVAQTGANNVLTPLYDNIVLVPEPSTLLLSALGTVGLVFVRRRGRQVLQ